jgi:hypothetical protein
MKKQKVKSNKKSAGGMKNLDVGIDSFGTLQMNNSIDAINKFLDENISDKKIEQKNPADKKSRKK